MGAIDTVNGVDIGSAGGRAERAIALWAERVLDDELGKTWSQAQRELDQLRFHQALRKRWRQARAEVAIRGAAACATLVGAKVKADQVRELVLSRDANQPHVNKDVKADEAVALAYWRAWAFAIEQWPSLGELGATLQLPPSRLLLTCVLLAGGEAIPHADTAALQVTLSCMDGAQNGIIRAGIVHAELAGLGGAWACVAHIGAVTQLVHSFVDPTGLAVPAVVAARDPLGYRVALAAYARGDVQRWLAYWVHTTARSVVEARAIADAVLAGTVCAGSAI